MQFNESTYSLPVAVIAKGDTLTLEERHAFRQRLKEDFAANDICIYPSSYEVEDSEEASLNSELEPFIPFAVIGSEQIYSLGSKRLLARKSKWGLVEVENPDHCDFIYFRNMIIRTHMQDLKEKTDQIHYEAYRRARLQSPHQYAESNI
ncbi:Neuronal-specific septin-3-like [Oopsacas minuta]|uniref:Neuronal-specific septin-3-like n=1 Tax=Oopsacas minuta TaxID=111878 RepID=A0AAV7JNR6_9METZ|nr:Neuronal-specific septin-3-like [Oopsacas minuta]